MDLNKYRIHDLKDGFLTYKQEPFSCEIEFIERVMKYNRTEWMSFLVI
ncbi:hypothetical protein C1A50_0682 [Paenibacillus polymyxa]|nr:hypothetical protein C1A50_0682 [Paenibacillus polymyxa]